MPNPNAVTLESVVAQQTQQRDVDGIAARAQSLHSYFDSRSNLRPRTHPPCPAFQTTKHKSVMPSSDNASSSTPIVRR